VTGATTAAGPGIELSGLAKSFGPVQAVRGVDVSIAPGEIVALLGPNGAGRSALGGDLWPGRGWLVVAAWTVVLGRLAARAYRRDTQRL